MRSLIFGNSRANYHGILSKLFRETPPYGDQNIRVIRIWEIDSKWSELIFL